MIYDEHTNWCINCSLDIYSTREHNVLSWRHEDTGRMKCTLDDSYTIYQATPGGQ